MTTLIQLNPEQLKTRLVAHCAGRFPRLPHVLVSHVRWSGQLTLQDVYMRLRELRPRGIHRGRHLLIDGTGGFWIDHECDWLAAIDDARTLEPWTSDPVCIDMLASAHECSVILNSQLHAVAVASALIGQYCQLTNLPSVRWNSIHLKQTAPSCTASGTPTSTEHPAEMMQLTGT